MKFPISNWWEFVGATLAALLTLGVYSFLYRENKISRICEHIFLGTSGAIAVVLAWEQMLLPKWWQPMLTGFGGLADGTSGLGMSVARILVGVLAILLGACWYLIFSRKYLWLARLVIGIVIGATAGLSFKMIFEAQMPQITQSVTRSLWAFEKDPSGVYGFSAAETINNIVFIGILLSVMVYFFFSFEQKHGAIRGMSRFGRWCLMITFGTYFGNTVMARMSLFIERFQFITEKWAIPGWHFLTHLH